jgi:hypothetical protein
MSRGRARKKVRKKSEVRSQNSEVRKATPYPGESSSSHAVMYRDLRKERRGSSHF